MQISLPHAHSPFIFQLVSWNSLSLLLCQHTKNYTRPWTLYMFASNQLLFLPQHLKACSQWANTYVDAMRSQPQRTGQKITLHMETPPLAEFSLSSYFGPPTSFCRIEFFFKRSLKTFPVFLSVGRGSVIYFKPRSAFSLYSYSIFPCAVSGTHLSKHSPQCHSQRESDNHNSPEDSMCCFQVYHQPAEAKN